MKKQKLWVQEKCQRYFNHNEASYTIAATFQLNIGCMSQLLPVTLKHSPPRSSYLVVRQLGIESLLLASVPRQRHYASQTEVVVVLFAELLLGQRVQRVHLPDDSIDPVFLDCTANKTGNNMLDGNLFSQDPGVLESLPEQIDFSDHAAVRHHHRDWPEHGFQIIGELGSARVTGIHRDEDAAGVHQPYFTALEHELGELLREGGEDREYLLRHHRQHFDIYAGSKKKAIRFHERIW